MALLVWLGAACGSDSVTEIELVVESRVEGVDRLRVEVTAPDGDTESSGADLAATPGPRRLRLRHQGGELGPVSILVRGLAGESERVSTRRVLAFEPGRTLRVEVVLSEACASLDCGAEETCGNEGRCRSAMVAACELEVGGCLPDADVVDAGQPDADMLDAGMLDGGPDDAATDAGTHAGDAAPDAGGCATFALCGVAPSHLPGDFIRPRACELGPDAVRISVRRGSTALPVFGGEAQVVQPGLHSARIETETCSAEMAFTVVGPTAYDFRDEPGALRDVAGRVDSAVMVTQDGAFALLDSGAVRVVGDGVTSGIHRDFNSAAYTSAGAWLGAIGGHRAYVFVPPPLGTSTPVEVELTDPIRGANRMGLPTRRESPVLYASSAGSVAMTSGADPGSVLDTRGVTWMAMGNLAEEGRGVVWSGNGNSLWNISTDARLPAFGGNQMFFEGGLPTVQTAVVDESAGMTSLWVCGLQVHRYDLVGNLAEATALPAPSVRVMEDCVDMALGDDGEVWVAPRFGGVIRLASDGTEILRYGAPQGLVGSSVFYRLDFASDDSGRSLWLLSRPNRAVIRFTASALAP